LHHTTSFSNAQNLETTERAFNRLIKRVQDNKNLPLVISKKAAERNLHYLFLYRKSFFTLFLKNKKYDEAYKIAKLFAGYPGYRYRSLLYFSLIYLLKIFPFAIYGIHLLRIFKRFKKSGYEEYAKYLTNNL